MAKIKITEGELKQVIRESVSEVLTEGNFGMNWDQLTDAEKQKFANRYNNWNLNGRWGKNAKGIDSPEVQQRYKAIQARKRRNGNATLSQAQGQRLQTGQNNLNSLYSQLGIDIKTPEKYGGEHVTAAQTAITDLKSKAEQLAQVQKELDAANKTIGAQKSSIANLTTQLQQSNAQLAQARNQVVRGGAAQPTVNQNQTVPAAKPIPQQTARPAPGTTPGTQLTQK